MYVLRAYCHWLRKIKGGILIYAQAEIPMVSGIKGDPVTRSQYIEAYNHVVFVFNEQRQLYTRRVSLTKFSGG